MGSLNHSSGDNYAHTANEFDSQPDNDEKTAELFRLRLDFDGRRMDFSLRNIKYFRPVF